MHLADTDPHAEVCYFFSNFWISSIERKWHTPVSSPALLPLPSATFQLFNFHSTI